MNKYNEWGFQSFQRETIIRCFSLDIYSEIIKCVSKCDVSEDKEFQRKYNAFFRVRRNEDWRKTYYSYFQRVKNKSITFDAILDYLYEHTGNIEASFSSKMLSTINPDMPIWDQFILKNLDIKAVEIIDKDPATRLKETKETYKLIVDKEKQLLLRQDIRTVVNEFKRLVPEYNLSDTKALDYCLWIMR